jgi:hypothetical protein
MDKELTKNEKTITKDSKTAFDRHLIGFRHQLDITTVPRQPEDNFKYDSLF